MSESKRVSKTVEGGGKKNFPSTVPPPHKKRYVSFLEPFGGGVEFFRGGEET